MKTIGPYLSFMHGVNTFAERFDGLIAENYAVGSESECVNNEDGIARTKEHNRARPRLKFAQLSQDAKAFKRPVLQFRADYNDIGLYLLDERKCVCGRDRAGDHSHTIAPWPKSRLDQLAIHFVRFCN